MKKFIAQFILLYFKLLANCQLLKLAVFKRKPLIVGITGTAGKTSTMSAVQAVSQDLGKTKISYKANSESGIPLNVLGLAPEKFSAGEWLRLIFLAPYKLITNWEKNDYYIVEMGIDGPHPPKNMSYLLTIIQPRVGILLNSLPMHSEPFDEIIDKMMIAKNIANDDRGHAQKRQQMATIAIAQEKGKMIANLPSASEKGVAILNLDQQEISDFIHKTKAKVLSYGKNTQADVRIVEVSQSLAGTQFVFEITSSNKQVVLNFPQYLLADHFAYTFASAICFGLSQGMSTDKIVKSLEKNFVLPPGRSSLIAGINKSWILDSSYNSSTLPLLDLLEMIDKINNSGGKKLALLGDIRELGKESQLEHETVAHKIVEKCDEAFLIGPEMKKYVLPVLEKAIKTKKGKIINAIWFQNAREAGEFLKKTRPLSQNDILLVKGSQNTLLLEIAVEMLMENPEEAEKLLCRRGGFWEGRRKKLY